MLVQRTYSLGLGFTRRFLQTWDTYPPIFMCGSVNLRSAALYGPTYIIETIQEMFGLKLYFQSWGFSIDKKTEIMIFI